MPAEKPISRVLAEVFRRGGMKRSVQRAQIVVMWPRVAGSELSRFTKASSFRDSVLYVETTDSETAMHLGLQRERFVKVFHEHGLMTVKDIRFRPGRIDEPPAPASPLPAEADSADLQPLTRSLGELDLSEDVASEALKAAGGIALTRTRRRQLGWRPCIICTTLCEQGGLCTTCARYSAEYGTQRAARLLISEPEHPVSWLTEDQRAVAAWLAAAQVDRHMLELLPQVLADQRLLPQLELLAGNWLVLSTGTPAAKLTDADWLKLPARIARVLGRG